jgi:hypothetical protein
LAKDSIPQFGAYGSTHGDRAKLIESINRTIDDRALCLRKLRYVALSTPHTSLPQVKPMVHAYDLEWTTQDACDAFLHAFACHLDTSGLADDVQDQHYLRACRAVGVDKEPLPVLRSRRKRERINAGFVVLLCALIGAALVMAVGMPLHNSQMDRQVERQIAREQAR